MSVKQYVSSLALLACVCLLVALCFRETASYEYDGRLSALRSAMMCRLGIGERYPRAELCNGYIEVYPGEPVNIYYIRLGSIALTLDGEALPNAPSSSKRMEQHEVAWEIAPRQLDASIRERTLRSSSVTVRRLYAKCLVDSFSESFEVHDNDWLEVATLEHNRLLRDMWQPWMLWPVIERQARYVAAICKGIAFPAFDESIKQLTETCRAIDRMTEEARLGALPLSDAFILSELNASDGKTQGARDARVHGLLSGGWLMDMSPHWARAGIAKYWDSNMMTRYAVSRGQDIWRTVTLGDRVQAYATRLVGRKVNLSEFLAWVEDNNK